MPKIEQRDIVNFDNIDICRKLRRLGKLDRIRIDETEHKSELNKRLFAYIEHSGSDVLSFVKNYLSNLQPYMIERASDQECEKGVICVIDNLYRVSVYIKVDAKQFEEVIVSFHESNKRGIASTNKIPSNRTTLNVPVFAEEEEGYSETSDKYAIKVFIQRGLKVFPVILLGKKYLDGVYIVSYWEIE